MTHSAPFAAKESIQTTNVTRLTLVATTQLNDLKEVMWPPDDDVPLVVEGKTVNRYVPVTGEKTKIADLPFPDPFTSEVLYLPSAKLAIGRKNDRSAWMTEGSGDSDWFVFPDKIGAFSIDFKSLRIGLGFDAGAIAIISAKSQVRYIWTETKEISALEFGPSGDVVFYAGNDRKIKSRSITDSREMPQLGDFDCIVRDIEFNADGSWVAVAGDCPRIRVWSLQKRDAPKTLNVPFGSITSVAFLPGIRANLLASAGTDGHLRIWNVEDGSQLRDMDSGQLPLKQVLFSPDGRWLVSVGQNQTIKFWAVK